MSLAQFEREVLGDRLGENDQVWFPRWMRLYAMSIRNGLTDDLPVNKDSVLKFSRSLLANGAPAWQRYQAVRAAESYRNFVLSHTEPDLSSIVTKLAQLVRQERQERNINLGHRDVETTMRYVHVRHEIGRSNESPMDTLMQDAEKRP